MSSIVAVTFAVLLSRGATVDGVVARVDATAGARMRAALAAAQAPAHPARLWLLGVKDERRLELWAEGRGGKRVLVRAWRMLAASGTAGPKLREGDLQVPEGVYRIDSLNPNSAYHLSLRVSYPNADDRARARRDGRTRLGGNIYIHGNAVSIGCIAIGDEAIEELFWLAATAGQRAFTVVIVPTDLRRNPAPDVPAVAWEAELYRTLAAELGRFPPAGG
jgi:murein L,D-transpeptidase YafK